MKLAHRQCIASTTIKLISKKLYCPFYQFYLKYFQRIVADPKRKLSPPFDSADSVPSLGHPASGSGKMLSLFTVLCEYPMWVTETGAPSSGKTSQPIRMYHYECCSPIHRVCFTMKLHVPLGQVPKLFTVPSHT